VPEYALGLTNGAVLPGNLRSGIAAAATEEKTQQHGNPKHRGEAPYRRIRRPPEKR
jgi:hypothetical protein